MKTTIGKKIKDRRLQMRLSQEELAKKTGYSDRTALKKYPRGKNAVGWNAGS